MKWACIASTWILCFFFYSVLFSATDLAGVYIGYWYRTQSHFVVRITTENPFKRSKCDFIAIVDMPVLGSVAVVLWPWELWEFIFFLCLEEKKKLNEIYFMINLLNLHGCWQFSISAHNTSAMYLFQHIPIPYLNPYLLFKIEFICITKNRLECVKKKTQKMLANEHHHLSTRCGDFISIAICILFFFCCCDGCSYAVIFSIVGMELWLPWKTTTFNGMKSIYMRI